MFLTSQPLPSSFFLSKPITFYIKVHICFYMTNFSSPVVGEIMLLRMQGLYVQNIWQWQSCSMPDTSPVRKGKFTNLKRYRWCSMVGLYFMFSRKHIRICKNYTRHPWIKVARNKKIHSVKKINHQARYLGNGSYAIAELEHPGVSHQCYFFENKKKSESRDEFHFLQHGGKKRKLFRGPILVIFR